MTKPYFIEKHAIHVWSAELSHLAAKEEHFAQIISADELERARRFQFPQHQRRFILTRGILRKIMGLYLDEDPVKIHFEYGPRGKPFLPNHPVYFNVSHSEERAIYAFSTSAEVGIDIQKVEQKSHERLAERFFSETENRALRDLNELEKQDGFYQLWASKEALIKAVGEGLHIPLADFSVDLQQEEQWVELSHENLPVRFYLKKLDIHPEFKAAVACREHISRIDFWEWIDMKPVKK